VTAPRQTRLVRVPDLRGLHAALGRLVAGRDPALVRATAVIVPTRGAAEALRRTLERRLLAADAGAFVLPDLVTRADFYLRLHRQLPGAPALLTPFEREVLLRRAARQASEAGAPAPFRLRARLIAAILDFYDDLRRNGIRVAHFEQQLAEDLEANADIDRGAERLLRQTRFLGATLAAFEGACAATGALDEHALRERLLAGTAPAAYRRVIVTVADQAADRNGLWPADYDLLSRAPGIQAVDILATEAQLAAGLHDRLARVLPGIEIVESGPGSPPPTLLVPEPPPGATAPRWFTSRDREEELADVVRQRRGGGSHPLDRTAIVYQRPLPYLYVARQLLPDAGLPYQALDALPLAAEPFAAALDLVFDVALSEATRGSLVQLLRSPHWQFTGRALDGREVDALDAWLLEIKHLGGWGRLDALAAASGEESGREAPEWREALAAAQTAASGVAAIVDARSASLQFRALLSFVRRHERPHPDGSGAAARHARARAAVLAALEGLAEAHARHDDSTLFATELVGAVRRWIEGQTFSPVTGSSGLVLLDARAAAYADVDEVHLLGLVESDWPERASRNIFYPLSLLGPLGWPAERHRLAASRAAFRDLLSLPAERVAVSTFTLEDDAIVPPSPFLEDVEAARLPVSHVPAPAPSIVFAQEAMRVAGGSVEGLDAVRTGWLAQRESRTGGGDPAYHGFTGPRPPVTYAVSRVERYLQCPFKYFAAHVLRLEEEQEEVSGLTQRERGALLHEVLEQFFREWAARGRTSITESDIEEARALFAEVAERHLAGLSDAERALERTQLLGSAVAPGLGERIIWLEIEHEAGVIERLLEHELAGEFELAGPDGPVTVRLRGKADRIDLLEDGTLRIVDYKLGRAPKSATALQLPIYSVCASRELEGRHGRSWPVSRAGYVAFREKQAFTAIGASTAAVAQALIDGQQKFVAAVARIERGEFPVDPEEPFMCGRCGYAGMCRKDYVGDE
jgi:RecB family exonuclease